MVPSGWRSTRPLFPGWTGQLPRRQNAAAISSFGIPLDDLDSVIAALNTEDAALVGQVLGGNQPLTTAVSQAATEVDMTASRNA